MCPVLRINAVITNEATNQSVTVDLKPVINLIYNLHYSENLNLPGAKTDKYTVVFTVTPPGGSSFLLHSDYQKQFRNSLFAAQKCT